MHNININVIYLGYYFVFIKSLFWFFCLQNLRSFCSFLYLVKKSKTFYKTILGVKGVIIYYTLDLN